MPTTLTPPRTEPQVAPPAAEAASREGTPASQGVLTIVDQAVVSLASFLAAVIVGQISKDELGVYTLAVGSVWMMVGVPNALVWSPYTSRASRMTRQQRQAYSASSARMSLAIGGLMFAGTLLGGLAALAIDPKNAWLPTMLLAMAPLAFTMTLREHVRRVLCADFRARRMLLLDAPIGILQITGLLTLWRLGRLNAESAIVLTAVLASISIPWVLVWARGAKVGSEQLRGDARSNWGFGRWLLIVAVTTLLGDCLLRWLLALSHGAEAIGQFSAVFAIVMLVNPLMIAMMGFARAWAARVYGDYDFQALLRHTRRTTIAGSALAAAVLLFLMLAGDFFVRMFFGAQYSDPLLLSVAGASICLNGVAIPAEAAFAAKEEGRRLAVVAMTRLFFSIVVGIPLVVLFGPIGVAWAMVIRSVASLALNLVLLLWGEPARSVSPAEGALQA